MDRVEPIDDRDEEITRLLDQLARSEARGDHLLQAIRELVRKLHRGRPQTRREEHEALVQLGVAHPGLKRRKEKGGAPRNEEGRRRAREALAVKAELEMACGGHVSDLIAVQEYRRRIGERLAGANRDPALTFMKVLRREERRTLAGG